MILSGLLQRATKVSRTSRDRVICLNNAIRQCSVSERFEESMILNNVIDQRTTPPQAKSDHL
jgi:hypothetical protein